ncbi:Alpha/beta hydrolase [Durusdinium trenchii]|uniref:Alpha/beta hydrolase n=1 Tax=Durusdinium trenchii TaxID=1381693 RepID=A0ABP0KVU9_9DINO
MVYDVGTWAGLGYAAIAAIQLMVANMELEHEMPKLSGLPVLILQGAEDRQTPLRAGEILHKQLAQSELNVFRSGHNLMPESSDAIRCCAEWLADFPMRSSKL